tara:strand:- start:365 stop:523 length:159 start_codon:yes stop_codon:yes gene_type:complete
MFKIENIRKNIILFLIAIVAYIFVDVGYNLTIGMSIDLYFYEQAGIIDIYIP